MTPSPQQQLIYTTATNREINICVNATAGSGKTTTLLELANQANRNYNQLFLSFSNTIVNELKRRIPSHVQASTIHSLGLSLLRSKYNRINIEKDKYFNLALECFEKRDKKTFSNAIVIKEICDYARLTLTPFESRPIGIMCDFYGIDADPIQIKWACDLLGNQSKRVSDIDFTDMLYLPVHFDLESKQKYDIIYLDEAQDTNKTQLTLLEKLCSERTQMISVGDFYQVIYGFAGNDPKSFQYLHERPNTQALPLSVCYRCAKEIVYEAQRLNPDIQPFEGKESGVVREGTLNEVTVDDLIICRNTAPLIQAYFALLYRNIPGKIIGKDMEKGLLKLVDKCGSPTTVFSLKSRLLDYEIELEDSLKENGVTNIDKHPKMISFLEKKQILLIIAGKCEALSQLKSEVQRIFNDTQKGVVLMTIHRSKGLENDRVFIIQRMDGKRLLPSQKATLDWELEQERNLEFVAITRAKKELVYVPNINSL